MPLTKKRATKVIDRAQNVDQLAERIAGWAKTAAQMPPSFDGDSVRQPMYGTGGEYVGHMLPGRGLYLGRDLKALGINRRIPHVYPYSPIARLLDKLQDERGAITTYDAIIAARAGGKAEDWACTKASHTTATNTWHSPMGNAGLPGTVTYLATTAPTDRVPDRATAGYFGILGGNTSGADKKYLLTFGWSAASAHNMILLHDVLTDSGAFRWTVLSAETIAVPKAITRQYTTTLGAGALITFIATTAVTTASTGTFTVQYTNQAGTGAKTVALNITAGETAILGRLFPIPGAGAAPVARGHHIDLAAGDYGVQKLEQTTYSVNTGVGGPLTGIVYQPLMWVPGLVADTYVERDSTAQIDGITELIQVSNVWGALGVFINCNAATSGVQRYFFRTCAG
jgi:hypothetical protein